MHMQACCSLLSEALPGKALACRWRLNTCMLAVLQIEHSSQAHPEVDALPEAGTMHDDMRHARLVRCCHQFVTCCFSEA